MEGGKVTEFHVNTIVTARHKPQNLISTSTKTHSDEGISTVENDKMGGKACL